VLWLDDLEKYLGPRGLTKAAIARVVSGRGHHRVIMATLGAVEDSRYCAPKNNEMLRESIEALAQARRIDLDRMFSTTERSRATTIADQCQRRLKFDPLATVEN
jgi:hypothetical protein